MYIRTVFSCRVTLILFLIHLSRFDCDRYAHNMLLKFLIILSGNSFISSPIILKLFPGVMSGIGNLIPL